MRGAVAVAVAAVVVLGLAGCSASESGMGSDAETGMGSESESSGTGSASEGPSAPAVSPSSGGSASELPSVPGRGASEATPGTGSEPSRPVEVLRGTLGGDAELEGGCTWLELDSGERVQVLYPTGYIVTADPVRLVAPDGEELAVAGDPLEVEVASRPDVMTTCQVGPVVEAAAVRPG